MAYTSLDGWTWESKEIKKLEIERSKLIVQLGDVAHELKKKRIEEATEEIKNSDLIEEVKTALLEKYKKGEAFDSRRPHII